MRKRVLILCTGNSARSQMAEGLLREITKGEVAVESAGLHPNFVRPEAIQVMAEIGIDISGHRSKHIDEFVGDHLDTVLTVCDNAREVCPIFPDATKVIHASFPDPAAVEGTEPERLAAFRAVRDQLKAYFEKTPLV
jgi:arsenate reductase